MATADTARMQHIQPGLGSARNVATAADLQHVRQLTCRLVSHFADQLTGALRSDAGSPATGSNAMAAQHSYLLVNAPLLETVTAMVLRARACKVVRGDTHQWLPYGQTFGVGTTGLRDASLADSLAPGCR